MSVGQVVQAPRDASSPPGEVARLLRLSVPVIVKLAARRMRLADVMKFASGTIIEFDKPAEDPLDLMVNNVAVGAGDVIKVGENFGLRITRIGQAEDTIRALGNRGK